MYSSLNDCKKNTLKYILSLKNNKQDFKFCKKSNISRFALCFAVQILFLLKEETILNKYKKIWIKKIIVNLKDYQNNNIFTKPFQQLLTLSMTSLWILHHSKDEYLKNICLELIPKNIEKYLHNLKVHEGKPGSGNLSMFIAIIFIYLKNYYNYNFESTIK